MAQGVLLRLPQAGSVLNQDDNLLSLMRVAHRVWFIDSYKLKNGIPQTGDDVEFMRAVLGITADGR